MSKGLRAKLRSKRWIKNHLINKFGAVCSYCGTTLETMKDITLDHIQPVSKGGSDLLDNFQLACYDCNHMKSDMPLEEFLEYQQ